MSDTIQKKLDEILKDLPPDKQVEVYDEFHHFMCKSIIVLLQDSIKGPGISQRQIETARELAEIKPNTEAAKEVLEFLDRKEGQ